MSLCASWGRWCEKKTSAQGVCGAALRPSGGASCAVERERERGDEEDASSAVALLLLLLRAEADASDCDEDCGDTEAQEGAAERVW
jgi:hypothetical protein